MSSLVVILWSSSYYYFRDEDTSSRVSPGESKGITEMPNSKYDGCDAIQTAKCGTLWIILNDVMSLSKKCNPRNHVSYLALEAPTLLPSRGKFNASDYMTYVT
jgi:hypothetical protein